MRAFGLTGNMGCGKSTVASLLSEYPDVTVLNCDQIAKEILCDPLHRSEVIEILSENVFPGGKIDVKAVARIIFNDPHKKEELEKFIHPKVWHKVEEKIGEMSEGSICIVESAILYEKGDENRFVGVVVALCTETEQLERLKRDRHMSEEEIQARIGSQIPQSEKEAKAQFVIHTDCDLPELRSRVEALYHNLTKEKK